MPQSSKKKKILLPAIKLKGGSYYLLSNLDNKWTFKAETINRINKPYKDVFGNKLNSVKGKGSIKCRPHNDDCLDFDLKLVPFPITEIGSERYILLSKKKFGDKLDTVDTWNFMATKLKDNSKKNRSHDPSNHNIGEVVGEKVVGISPGKTFNTKNF